MEPKFDVFISYNRQDSEAALEIHRRLRGMGLVPWLDKHELAPGRPWQTEIEKAVKSSRSALVLLGPAGLGRWEQEELPSLVEQALSRDFHIIPVLLEGVSETHEIPFSLRARTWVDLRHGITDEGLSELAWGITGRRANAADALARTSSPSPPAEASEDKPSERRTDSPPSNEARMPSAVNVEVYDRRIVVYRNLHLFLLHVIGEGEPDIARIRDFGAGIQEALFLFGDDIDRYLNIVYERAIRLRTLAQVKAAGFSETRTPTILDEEAEIINWFTAQFTAARQIFRPYLSLQ